MKNDVRPCKFILLFQGRTGSTYITERVDAHPRVKMEPEVWGGWGFQLSREKIPLYSQKQLDWLMSFYDKDYNIPYSAIGFKTKLDDVIDKRSFIRYIREKNIKIIHMTRKNIVKLVISEINAQRLFDITGKWNLDNKAERPGPFNLDLDEFDAKMKWRAQIEDWLDSYVKIINNPTLQLCYEDLLFDEVDFFKKLYGFIGTSPMQTMSKTIKNTPTDLREIIINYDELLQKYKYTCYEPMILDV
jgi:hypothetical protein